MNIIITHGDNSTQYINHVKNYDFYPETKMLFVETLVTSLYVPINRNVKFIEIEGGTERGYLEGHDEAR